MCKCEIIKKWQEGAKQCYVQLLKAPGSGKPRAASWVGLRLMLGAVFLHPWPLDEPQIYTGGSLSPAVSPRWTLDLCCSFVFSPISWIDLGHMLQPCLKPCLWSHLLLLLDGPGTGFINFALFRIVDGRCYQYAGLRAMFRDSIQSVKALPVLGQPRLLACTTESPVKATWPHASPSSYTWKKEWEQSVRESMDEISLK